MKIVQFICACLSSFVMFGGRIVKYSCNRLIRYYQVIYLLGRKVKIKKISSLYLNGNAQWHIARGSNVSIGDDFVCNSGPKYSMDIGVRSKINVEKGARLIIGDHSGMSNSIIQCHKEITIGNYVNIGAGTLIMDTNFHSLNWFDRENRTIDVKKAKVAPIEIEDYVFIGARTIICKGVKIGQRSVVAAGSVVTQNIPTDVIAGGNPCRVIKSIKNNVL